MDDSIPENFTQRVFNFDALSNQPFGHVPSSINPLKKCSKCPEGQQWHPATDEFFGPDKRGKGGLRSICRQCRNKHEVNLRQNRLDERRVYERQYRETHREEIRESNRRYEQKTKGKRAEYFKQYYKDHPGVARRASRKYYYRHREACNTVSRLYTFNNPEKVRKLRQIWESTHREQRKAISHKRRASKKGNGGMYTAQDVQNKLISQKHKCYYCHNDLKKKEDKYIYHIEHVLPISRGGSNCSSNIVVSCPACNCKKGNKLLHEWLECGRLL